MPAKPIPRQLRASALAFAVRCSVRDAPPVASPQPADEEDDALANGYDAPDDEDASDESDGHTQPAAVERSPGERFWSRAQSRRRRRRGRDLDAEEAARLAARAPPQPPSSPVVEPSAWEQRQEREINAFVRAKHHAQRQRAAEIRHAAARARKAPTKRRVAIRLPPAGQREDKLRAAATARQQEQEPERRRTVTWDSESDAERMRTLRTKISAVGHVGGHTAAPIPWARVVGDADDGSADAASEEEASEAASEAKNAAGCTLSRLALEFRREELRRRRQKELANIRATEAGISCALRSAALRREAVREARTVDRRRRDRALPAIFAKPQEVNHTALSPLGMMLASASAAREQPRGSRSGGRGGRWNPSATRRLR